MDLRSILIFRMREFSKHLIVELGMCKNTCIGNEVWLFSGILSRIQPLAHTPWSFHLNHAVEITCMSEIKCIQTYIQVLDH